MNSHKQRLETLEEFATRLREIHRTINKRLIPSTGLMMMLGRIRRELHDEFATIYSHLSCFEDQRIRTASYFLGTAYLFEDQEFAALKEIRRSLPNCGEMLLALGTGEEFYRGHIELYQRRIKNKQEHSVSCLSASLYFMPTPAHNGYSQFNQKGKENKREIPRLEDEENLDSDED